MDSLFGLTFSKMFQLFKDNKFSFSFKKLAFVVFLFIMSIKNSFLARKESQLDDSSNIEMKDPIFILGHWRSGTSFLHNLLIQDNSFIYPKIYQVIHPFTFLNLKRKYMAQIKARKVEARPMDNVKNDPLLPGEEEFAMAAITLKSPIVGWAFPKRYDYYEQFLSLEKISKKDKNLWKTEYQKYLKKVAMDNGNSKQLLLKSPTNTARIRFLLELYPNAKFINIHRDPLDLFGSILKLHDTAIKSSNLQVEVNYDISKRIISTYKKLYDEYFDALDLIPKNNFVDVSFEDLEKEPLKVINDIYRKLNLKGFEEKEKHFTKYISSLKDYKKNNHGQLDSETVDMIKNEWNTYYKNWGYYI